MYCNASNPDQLRQQKQHPLGAAANVLLTSVFKPFARDDVYGSRTINPMELYHNQVTKVQGPFSLRMFHRSCGIKLIQANISAPCTLLDYPSRERFRAELRSGVYNIVGISAIPANLKKVADMCRIIRRESPSSTIVVGGHISNLEELDVILDVDIVVRGEGVRWFRTYLGEDPRQPIDHPVIASAIAPRCMGINLPAGRSDVAAVLIPSVGCPMGCNFCSTSAMFGGKGHFVNFYENGDELFAVMNRIQEKMKSNTFFVLDENFLYHRKRALELLDLMQQHGKTWELYIFSSADILAAYSTEQLIGLGISWVWIGVEGRFNRYAKNEGVDIVSLVRKLQANGIRVLGSTIIGLEDHSPENMEAVIDWSVALNTDFHQFMLYFAPPGTPLYRRLEKDDNLLREPDIEIADVHGQYRFNHRHPAFTGNEEQKWLQRAFQRDFDVNGPSVIRMMGTLLKGWSRHKAHPEKRIRDRFRRQARKFPTVYAGAVWATRRRYRPEDLYFERIDCLLRDIYRAFGPFSRLGALSLGVVILFLLWREDKRRVRKTGWEPPTILEKSSRKVSGAAKRHDTA